jgi:hypothetical protein
MARKRAVRKSRKKGGKGVNALFRPENYVSFGYNNQDFGLSTGGADPTLALNDALMNGGAQIQLGTGTNLRLGRHILFTRLLARLCFYNATQTQRVRIVVGKSITSNDASSLVTVNTLTAFIEGNAVMEAPINGGVVGPIDRPINPSSDYIIMHDKIYGTGGETGLNYVSGICRFSCELDIPLNLQRTYDIAGNPDQGSWFMYICTDTASLNQAVYGNVRLDYINQWSFEGIGQGVRSFVDAAGNTIDHWTKSKLAGYVAKAAPYVFGAMS